MDSLDSFSKLDDEAGLKASGTVEKQQMRLANLRDAYLANPQRLLLDGSLCSACRYLRKQVATMRATGVWSSSVTSMV